jgi:CheY-like chemotaxis protein
MPEMDGEEVLAAIRSEPRLGALPVIIVSSEEQRARRCVEQGATAALPKPIRPDELRVLVARVLDEAEARKRSGNLPCLPVSVGGVDLALPLDAVERVLARPAVKPLATGPAFLSAFMNLHGKPICVLDLALRLGVDHTEAPVEQKLVIVKAGGLALALSVDDVHDPEEVPESSLVRKDAVAGSAHGELGKTLLALAKTARGDVPVIDPSALVSPELLGRLTEELSRPGRTETGVTP